MSIDPIRERLTHLYQFFKAVEERRTPKIVDVNQHKWVMWLDSFPTHSKLKLISPTPENGEWLVIQKPSTAPCPLTQKNWTTGWIGVGMTLRLNSHQKSKKEPSKEAMTMWSLRSNLAFTQPNLRRVDTKARAMAFNWDAIKVGW